MGLSPSEVLFITWIVVSSVTCAADVEGMPFSEWKTFARKYMAKMDLEYAKKHPTQRECLNVVSYADEEYLPGWTAMAESVCLSSSSYGCVNFYVIVPATSCAKERTLDKDGDWLARLYDIKSPLGGCYGVGGKIQRACFDPKDFMSKKLISSFSYDVTSPHLIRSQEQVTRGMGYSRMFTDRLFPHLGGLVLFLDADTLVVDDLSHLMNLYTKVTEETPFPLPCSSETIGRTATGGEEGEENACTVEDWGHFPLVGAVKMRTRSIRDAFNLVTQKGPLHDLTKSYDMNALCFQTGVMVADMDLWRAFQVSAKFVDWTGKNVMNHLYSLGEQDALNLIFYNHTFFLPPSYNVYGLGSAKKGGLAIAPADWDKAKILHWSGPLKPWQEETFAFSSRQPLDLCQRSSIEEDIDPVSLWTALKRQNPVLLEKYPFLVCPS